MQSYVSVQGNNSSFCSSNQTFEANIFFISAVNICGSLVNCHILASYLQVLERQISLSMYLEDCQSSGSGFLARYLHF